MFKKILVSTILGAAALFSNAGFAYYHTHDDYPRFKYFRHHHHSRWKNIHRWIPPEIIL